MERGVRRAGPQRPAVRRGTVAEPCRRAERRAPVSPEKPHSKHGGPSFWAAHPPETQPCWGRGRPLTPPDLLDHDAVGPSQLQPSGEVQCVHPAQDQREDHDGQVRLDAAQVQPRRDDHQHRVDEAGGEPASGCAPTATTGYGPSQAWGGLWLGGPRGSPHTRAAGRSRL